MITINPRISAKGGTWDDLRFPAQAINPPGAVNDMTVEATTGMLLAVNNAVRLVAGVTQIPHSWIEGSKIKPHVHWQKTADGAGNVLWQFDYDLVLNGDVAPYTYADQLQIASSALTDNDLGGESLISDFGEIEMTTMKASSLIFWKLSRIGNDALDTYGDTARLVEFDIHYLSDSGSKTEYIKVGY